MGDECTVIATESAISLLVRAIDRNLREDGFGHLKVGLLEGPGIAEYVRDQQVISLSLHALPSGMKLIAESETLDVARIIKEGIARAAADLFHELLSGQAGEVACVSPSQVKAELLRLLDEN